MIPRRISAAARLTLDEAAGLEQMLESHVAGTVKRDQSIREPAIVALAPAIAAFALVIGLGWLYAHPLHPPPVHLVKCAAIEGSPCFPDPGMQRLGFPQPLPFDVPRRVEVGPPQFGPSR